MPRKKDGSRQKPPADHKDIPGNADRMMIRANKAFDLHVAGLGVRKIAERLRERGYPGLSHQTVWTDIKRVSEELRRQTFASADQMRQTELRRLEDQTRALWGQRRDPEVARTLVRIAERRAKLGGLDQPFRVVDETPAPALTPLRKVGDALLAALADAIESPE